jgi:hypothetical protein
MMETLDARRGPRLAISLTNVVLLGIWQNLSRADSELLLLRQGGKIVFEVNN